MPINHGNIWQPDHCGCSINIGFDDTLPLDKRVLVYLSQDQWREIFRSVQKREPIPDEEKLATERSCAAHTPHHGKPKHYDVVVEENRRKNSALNHFVEIMDEKYHVSSGRWQIHVDPSQFSYSFDNSRVCHVSFDDEVQLFRIHTKLPHFPRQYADSVQVTAAHKTELQKRLDLQHGKGRVIVH